MKSRTRRGTGWRSELLYLAMAGIEVLWLTPWFMVIAPGARELPGAEIIAFVAANVIGALLLVRQFSRRTSEQTTQIAFFVGLAAALLITLRFVLPYNTLGSELPLFVSGKLFFPPLIFTVLLVVLFWYRGLQIATTTITPARASFSLRVGIVLQIFAALVPDPRVQRTVLLLLPGFFFVGLMASSMARSASLRVNRELQRSSFGGGWIGFTALIGGALSLGGFVASLLLAGFRFDGIMNVLGQLAMGVLLVIVTILEPFLRVIAAIIDTLLKTLFNRPGGFNLDNMITDLKTVLGDPNAQSPAAQRLFAFAPLLCLVSGCVLVIVILLITLRNRSRINLREGEERESLDNAAILNSLLATLQRGLGSVGDALNSLSRFGVGGATSAFTIRRLYARMSHLAEQHGYPRGAAQTPFEYQAAVQQAFPEFAMEIDLLTRAYVDVHYGELPDDPASLQAAQLAVERMASLPAKSATA